MPSNAEFYRKLGDLLEEYGVEINGDGGKDIWIDAAKDIWLDDDEPYWLDRVNGLDRKKCRELAEGGCDGD